MKEYLKQVPYIVLGRINGLLWRLVYSLSWSTLRDIQHNRVVKSTYAWLFIVPITAKIFSKIDSELSFAFNNQTITFDLTLPFSWQALFFSAVFFVLANLSVSFFIPELIKKYKDFSEFSDSGKTKANLDEIKSSLGHISSKEIYRLREMSENKNNETEDEFKNQFNETYLRICYGNKLIRFICSGLYVIGFLFIIDICHQNLLWVMEFTDLRGFKDQLFFAPIIDWIANAI